MVPIFNIIKKLIFLLMGMGFMTNMYAQNAISISGNTRLITRGNVQLVLGAGSVVNNGALSGSTGTLVFAVPVNFSGTGTTEIQNFTIAHSSPGFSILNAAISVTNTANLMFGNFNANNNLMIRSDQNDIANLVVSGALTGKVQGIIAKATATAINGDCRSFSSTLSLNISGPMLTYQWMTSSDSATWSNINGPASNSYNTTVTNTIFYRCLISAFNTGFTSSPPGIKLTLDSPRAAISGITSLQPGNTASLTGTTAGGVWTSSNTGVVSVNASGVITGISPGTANITYIVTNSGGCSARAISVITVGSGNKPFVKTTDPIAICAPATVDLTATAITSGSDPGLTYTYYSNAAATNQLTSPGAIAMDGTYYIRGTNSSGVASDPVPVTVTINPLPSGNITAAQGTVLCGTSSTVRLSITGGNTYTWFKNGVAIPEVTGNQLTVTVAGVYTANLINATGCHAAAANSITITSIQGPKAAFTFDSYCTNNPVHFYNTYVTAVNGQLSYQWSDNTGRISTLNSPSFTYTKAGKVSMTLKITSLVCPALADSMTRIIPVEQPAVAVSMKSLNVLINEPLAIQARDFGSSYLWTPATGLSNPDVANPKTTLSADQEYRIIIKTPSSCITVDTVLVRVFDNRIYVPNVFTPNGDGINDKLFINLAGIRQLHYFRVFNRYAKLIFETSDASIGWDGRFNNMLQPMDTYLWIAEVIDKYGQTTIQKGSVTLLR